MGVMVEPWSHNNLFSRPQPFILREQWMAQAQHPNYGIHQRLQWQVGFYVSLCLAGSDSHGRVTLGCRVYSIVAAHLGNRQACPWPLQQGPC